MEPQQPLFDRRQLVMMLVTGVILMLWMPLAPRLFPGLFGVKPDAAAKAPDDKAAEKALPDKAADAPIAETKPTVAAEVKAAPQVAPAPAPVVDANRTRTPRA